MSKLKLLFITSIFLQACFTIPLRNYKAPPKRPETLTDYYKLNGSYTLTSHQKLFETPRYQAYRISLATGYGEATVDFYQSRKINSDLILVFPILGGRENIDANYFSDYFARNGFDCAIVHRDKSFKDPEHFDRLESILRDSLIRDRLILDYFQNEYNKQNFGSFGISRGAINVALTAGVDSRLKYNVMALGGSNLAKLFAKSKERRIKKYRRKIQEEKQITGEEFVKILQTTVKTDPINTAKYLDAKNTLMFLSLFDRTVPVKYGRELRAEIGKPKTIFLLADHRFSLLYTQFVPLIPPNRCLAIFPFDYIEQETLAFFSNAFKRDHILLKHALFNIVQAPFMFMERLIWELF